MILCLLSAYLPYERLPNVYQRTQGIRHMTKITMVSIASLSPTGKRQFIRDSTLVGFGIEGSAKTSGCQWKVDQGSYQVTKYTTLCSGTSHLSLGCRL